MINCIRELYLFSVLSMYRCRVSATTLTGSQVIVEFWISCQSAYEM
jgi:hypothetical protein